MATSPQELNKLPSQFRQRSGAAVLNITTPEVQPNLGSFRRSSAKKMLVNVQEEGAKTLGKKQRRAQLNNPVVDPSIDKRMLKRGIYSDVSERFRSATFAPSNTMMHSRSSPALLPPPQARRASLPYGRHDITLQQPSINGSPQHFASGAPGRSMDSGVILDTVEKTSHRPQALSNSLEDMTEQRSQTNTTQVQFPLSLANNATPDVTTVQKCSEHLEHVLTQHGVCVVCDVLHNEQPVVNKDSLVNHLVSEQREIHSRDSGIGNELQLNILPNTDHRVSPVMMAVESLPSPSKGSGFSHSVEVPSTESRSMDFRSSLREKDFFETTNDLAKESAHFTMADLLIAAAEECKCNNREKLMDSDSTTKDFTDTHSDNNRRSHQVLQPVMQPVIARSDAGSSSAEYVTHQFLRYIEELMIGASATGLTPVTASSVVEHFTSALSSRQSELSAAKSITCNRGDEQWAPPRQQVIFTSPPSLKRHEALLIQEYRCHGCGMKVDKDLSKHFRYCHYSGKYFCLSCHSNSQNVIPAMVLNKWVFKKYPISNYAKSILDKTHDIPVFIIDSLKPDLYSRCPQLNRVRLIRQQLVMVKKYLLTCKFAEELHEKLTQMRHLTFDVHSYSLSDLTAVNAGQLHRPLQSMLTESIKHIRSCDLCKQRGFICEFCKNQQDILYPFELDRVTRCVCHACFHKECYVREKCPRCLRLKLRQQQRNCIDYDIS